MTLLRLYCPLLDVPVHCDWVLIRDKGETTNGRSLLKDLPRRTDRIEVILPAADVLITQTRLPAGARRGGPSVLKFAVEEKVVNDPEANQVGWLGKAADNDALAVFDRQGFSRWRKALSEAGIRTFEVHSEMHLLPRVHGEWSVAWNGREAFVRSGDLEAMATDAGDATMPPLALRMLIDQVQVPGDHPAAIALYVSHQDAVPDLNAWESSLGVPVRMAGIWSWRSAPPMQGKGLAQETPRWYGFAETAPKLRLAAWVAGAALALHGVALTVDWALLAREQRDLRRQMDVRFRTTFPDAVAVVDPVLQMRRKLAEARHTAGKPDAGDFLPMIEKISNEIKGLPAGTVRILSYDAGRLTVEASPVDERTVKRIVERLRQTGFATDGSSATGRATISVRVP